MADEIGADVNLRAVRVFLNTRQQVLKETFVARHRVDQRLGMLECGLNLAVEADRRRQIARQPGVPVPLARVGEVQHAGRQPIALRRGIHGRRVHERAMQHLVLVRRQMHVSADGLNGIKAFALQNGQHVLATFLRAHVGRAQHLRIAKRIHVPADLRRRVAGLRGRSVHDVPVRRQGRQRRILAGTGQPFQDLHTRGLVVADHEHVMGQKANHLLRLDGTALPRHLVRHQFLARNLFDRAARVLTRQLLGKLRHQSLGLCAVSRDVYDQDRRMPLGIAARLHARDAQLAAARLRAAHRPSTPDSRCG